MHRLQAQEARRHIFPAYDKDNGNGYNIHMSMIVNGNTPLVSKNHANKNLVNGNKNYVNVNLDDDDRDP
jgi:hypothetical protein